MGNIFGVSVEEGRTGALFRNLLRWDTEFLERMFTTLGHIETAWQRPVPKPGAAFDWRP